MLLRHIRSFLAVAEQRSFRRAADALHVSPRTLSQQVRQFEDMLGVQLFDRSGRTVRLTEFGEVYARHARAALQELDTGQRALVLCAQTLKRSNAQTLKRAASGRRCPRAARRWRCASRSRCPRQPRRAR